MEGIKRPHRGERAWCELLRRFDSSGQSVADFCKREHLSRATFQRWRARLMLPSPSQLTAAAPERSVEQRATNFIDLGSLGAASAGLTARFDLKLDLGGGLILHLVRG